MGHFFCLWLVMWSKMNPQNSNAPKGAAKRQKTGVSASNPRIILGSCSSMNLLSHPYQLIPHPQNASIRCLGGIFVPEKRRQWCFPLHCLRPPVSYCGSALRIRLLKRKLALRHSEHKIALYPSYLGRYSATLITACLLSQLILPIYWKCNVI